MRLLGLGLLVAAFALMFAGLVASFTVEHELFSLGFFLALAVSVVALVAEFVVVARSWMRRRRGA